MLNNWALKALMAQGLLYLCLFFVAHSWTCGIYVATRCFFLHICATLCGASCNMFDVYIVIVVIHIYMYIFICLYIHIYLQLCVYILAICVGTYLQYCRRLFRACGTYVQLVLHILATRLTHMFATCVQRRV